MTTSGTVRPRRVIMLLSLLAAALGASGLVAPPAFGAVSITRAEATDDRLRIEGRATANRTITVDGVGMTTSDGAGSFRVSRSPYTPPADCTVDVNDGSPSPISARLAGCTVTATSPPAPAQPVTISPEVSTLGPAYVGADFASTASRNLINLGPDVTGPVRWEVTAGALPDGLTVRVPEPAGRPPLVEPTFMYLEGIPTTVQSSTFALRATDANGKTATRTYTIAVEPPRPLAIAPQPWPPLTVGQFGNLWLDGSGGVPPYQWSVSAGELPPGTSLVDDTLGDALVRVAGTPTASGTYTWTTRLTDARATTLDRTFSVTVRAAAGLASVSLDPTSVTGGSTSTGSVSLSEVAPPAGAAVSLSSSNPAVASVQSNLFVLAAASTATFTVSTAPVGSPTSVTVSATYGGVTRTADLLVEPAATSDPGPAVGVAEVTLTPSTVSGGSGASGSVRLSSAAPPGGIVVALSSAGVAATTPAQVSVAGGSTSATFAVMTTPVPTTQSVTIAATYGTSTAAAVLTVTPAVVSSPTLSAPSLLSPATDARWAPGVSRVFDWSDVAGATGYLFQVSNTTAFSSVELERSSSSSQLSVSFASEGTRYWRVSARDAAGTQGPWSAIRSFRVKR